MPSTPSGGPSAGTWLMLFCLIAGVIEPVSLALATSRATGRLAWYGPPAYAFAAWRFLVAGLGLASARAVWTRHPAGASLASWWVVADAADVILTAVTPFYPSNRLPGTKAPVVALAVDAAWWLYFRRSRRVRQLFPDTDA